MTVAELNVAETNNNNTVDVMPEDSPVFYSTRVGVTFVDTDDIVSNSHMIETLAALPEETITREDGFISFTIDTFSFAYFMHMLYGNIAAEFYLKVAFDGIYQFIAPDENGVSQKFNAQLVTVSQQPL